MARTKLTDITKTMDATNAPKPGERKKTNLHQARARDALVEAFKGTSKQTIQEVNPKECVVFEHNDREFQLLTQADVQDLIDGFMDPAIGQLQPAIARKAPADSDYKYEIIAGSRRLRAALWVTKNTSIKIPFKIVLYKFTDVEALKAMREENDYEKPSAYERAFATKRQIEKIFGDNLTKYCEAMGEKTTTVSELLAYTQIPGEILDAYSSRKDIPLKHPVKLRMELGKNEKVPGYKSAMIKEAKVLAKLGTKPSPANVLKQLLKAANDAIVTAKPKEAKKVAIKVGADKKGIEVTVSKTGITTIRLNKACNSNMEEARGALNKYLEEHFKG